MYYLPIRSSAGMLCSSQSSETPLGRTTTTSDAMNQMLGGEKALPGLRMATE